MSYMMATNHKPLTVRTDSTSPPEDLATADSNWLSCQATVRLNELGVGRINDQHLSVRSAKIRKC